MKTTSETPRTKLDILGLSSIATGVFFFIAGLFVLFYGLYPSPSIFTEGMSPPYHALQPCIFLGVILIIIAIVLFINGAYRIKKKKI
ncbi:MAG: hypothetical protein IMZ43_10555 [Thermoplasmata archaeon]|jgi:hypothetical protein|nr:hypothetical protein [Thermoplasmata archaeon]